MTNDVRSFKELKVWQQSFALCRRGYEISERFPSGERYGLISQLRRTALSIPSDIAEGHSRDSARDDLRFAWMAKGSLAELETQLMPAKELGMGDTEEIEDALLKLLDEIGRMLRGLIRALRGRTRRASGNGSTAGSKSPVSPTQHRTSLTPHPSPLDPRQP